MKKPTSKTKRPAKKDAAAREKEQRLTERYAATARRNELRPGDELSELEPVGKKPR